MRIFVTGANGQLARNIVEQYPEEEIYLATREKLDVAKREKVIKKIREFQPDIIFHLASLTRGDACAQDPEKAFRINVDGTAHVAEAGAEVGAELLFVSSNEVFDGKEQKEYTEEDIPNPVSVAGKTKLEAEKRIKKFVDKHFIVRTSWLYSKWGSNFVHVILNKAKNEGRVELVIDEVSTPTYSLDLAVGLKKLLKTKKYGVYHLSNSGIASRYTFGEKALQLKNLTDITIVPIKLSDYKRLSKPPLYSPLKNVKAKKLGITLPKWEEALERFLKD